MVRSIYIGASGRIGRLIRTLPQLQGAEILWALRRPDPDLPDALIWPDLSDPSPLLSAARNGPIDTVFGFFRGALDGSGPSDTNLALATLDAARKAGVRQVLLASSSAVYGAGHAPYREEDTCAPLSPYGAAKHAMEQAVAGVSGVTCLRIGNVAGADALMGGWRGGVVTLDINDEGRGPKRSYIGPMSLRDTLVHLAGLRGLPPVLNVGGAPAVTMDALLDAAGITWRPRLDIAAARDITLDCHRLAECCPQELIETSPDQIVAQWQRVRA